MRPCRWSAGQESDRHCILAVLPCHKSASEAAWPNSETKVLFPRWGAAAGMGKAKGWLPPASRNPGSPSSPGEALGWIAITHTHTHSLTHTRTTCSLSHSHNSHSFTHTHILSHTLTRTHTYTHLEPLFHPLRTNSYQTGGSGLWSLDSGPTCLHPGVSSCPLQAQKCSVCSPPCKS